MHVMYLYTKVGFLSNMDIRTTVLVEKLFLFKCILHKLKVIFSVSKLDQNVIRLWTEWLVSETNPQTSQSREMTKRQLLSHHDYVINYSVQRVMVLILSVHNCIGLTFHNSRCIKNFHLREKCW